MTKPAPRAPGTGSVLAQPPVEKEVSLPHRKMWRVVFLLDPASSHKCAYAHTIMQSRHGNQDGALGLDDSGQPLFKGWI